MISGIFHSGSGLGNQLFRYIGTRTIAESKKEEHAMVATDLFKGKDFLQLDMEDAGLNYDIEYPSKKTTVSDLKGVDVVDGEFQSETEFNIEDVRKWITTIGPHQYHFANTCIINFRGGEYVGVRDLFLPQEYWDMAVEEMLKINPNMRFEVHTDDEVTASKFFPNYPIVSDIERNWKAVRFASYLILSNSSFAIIPALMNTIVQEIIAPKYWAGYNKGYWQEPNNFYKKFKYIHHED